MVSVIFPLGVLLPTVFSRPALTSAATSSCRTGWIVQQQSLSPSGLSDVSAAGQGDAWAVGTGGLFPDTTLIEHWNGTSWKRIPSPSPPRKGTSGDFLSGVAALAPNNAWAVGGLGAVSGITLDTLIEHWNGSSWAVVKSPSPVVAGNELSAVAAFSTKDIWAVGGGDTTSAKGTAATLALHWDGADLGASLDAESGRVQRSLRNHDGPGHRSAVGSRREGPCFVFLADDPACRTLEREPLDRVGVPCGLGRRAVRRHRPWPQGRLGGWGRWLHCAHPALERQPLVAGWSSTWDAALQHRGPVENERLGGR